MTEPSQVFEVVVNGVRYFQAQSLEVTRRQLLARAEILNELEDSNASLCAERDEARREAQRLRDHHAVERDRLRDALRRARLDVTDVGTSGWDSTRLERTKEAVARIDAALAESEETT